MNVAIVIPARLGSTRLPGKVLADIQGRPMLAWVWEAARGVASASSVWVATDSQEVLDAVARFGGQGILTASHHTCGTERVAEAAEKIDADAILNLQGDSPWIPSSHLETLVNWFQGDTVPMATLVAPITERSDLTNPSRVKVVARHDGRALYFSRSAIPFDRDGDGASLGFIHIGVYIYRKEFLRTFTRLPAGRLESLEKLEQLRALEHGYDIGLVEVPHYAGGIDTPEDLQAAKIVARKVHL